MKKIIILLSGILLTTISCERDMTSLNVNPKAAETIPSRYAFASGQYDLFNTIYDPGTQAGAYPFLVQHLAETTYTTPSKFSLDTNSSNEWDRIYLRLQMLNNAKGFLSSEADAGSPSGKNKLAMIEILMCLGFQNLVDTYGDVPYSDALKKDATPSILSPKYDDAKTIYVDLINRLDNAIGMITSSTAGYTEDAFYKGDMSKWLKLANTVKYSLGINLADADPVLSKKVCEEAYNKGVLASNSDNVILAYDGASYKNPYSTTREDIVAADTFVNQLKAKNDPRVDKYFSKVGGTVVGGVFGNQNVYASTSTFNSAVSASNAKATLLDYAQVEFWLAEGAARGYNVGNAEDHYKKGIAASMDLWGVDSATRDSYIANNPYSSANYKASIGLQSWFAGYTKPYFTWNSVRRLDSPVLVNPVKSVLTSYPYRLSYPNGEQNLNKANWSAAVAHIPGGSDTPTAKVFWDKN